MVKRYEKGSEVQLSKHFNLSMFDCKCSYPECLDTLVHSDLLSGLDHLTDIFGSIKINSGFRCRQHNKDVGGEPGSFHTHGYAADCFTMFASIKEFAFAALTIEQFAKGGLGIYTNFLHLDVREEGPARWGDLSLIK